MRRGQPRSEKRFRRRPTQFPIGGNSAKNRGLRIAPRVMGGTGAPEACDPVNNIRSGKRSYAPKFATRLMKAP